MAPTVSGADPNAGDDSMPGDGPSSRRPKKRTDSRVKSGHLVLPTTRRRAHRREDPDFAEGKAGQPPEPACTRNGARGCSLGPGVGAAAGARAAERYGE